MSCATNMVTNIVIIKINKHQFKITYYNKHIRLPVLWLAGGEDCTYNATIYATNPERRCPEERGVATLLMAVYVLFANVLLLNILIAMFRWGYHWKKFIKLSNSKFVL